MTVEEPPNANPRDGLATTIAVAALTTLVTHMAAWLVDELRARYGSRKPDDPPSRPT